MIRSIASCCQGEALLRRPCNLAMVLPIVLIRSFIISSCVAWDSQETSDRVYASSSSESRFRSYACDLMSSRSFVTSLLSSGGAAYTPAGAISNTATRNAMMLKPRLRIFSLIVPPILNTAMRNPFSLPVRSRSSVTVFHTFSGPVVHLVLQTAPNFVSLSMPFGFNALVPTPFLKPPARASDTPHRPVYLTTTRHVLTIPQGGDLNCAAR